MEDNKPEETVVSVLREQISLLRELLEGKNNWLTSQLETERARNTSLNTAYNETREKNKTLEVALGRALQEIYLHNEQEDNPHETSTESLTRWEELVST